MAMHVGRSRACRHNSSRTAVGLTVFTLCVFAIGCDKKTESHVVNAYTSSEQHNTLTNTETLKGLTEYDFGTVFTRGGDALRHEFELLNSSDRPIRLLGATAYTPCCSAIGPLPDTINPRSSLKIPITFHPGSRVGLNRVAFSIQTDSEQEPIKRYSITANLLPQCRIELVTDTTEHLMIGEKGSQTFRVTCHHNKDAGLASPIQVKVVKPFQATFLGTSAEHLSKGEDVVESREIQILIPASGKTGLNRGEFELVWSNGYSQTHIFSWNVFPSLDVFPSAIIIRGKTGTITSELTVKSRGDAFQITSILGEGIVAASFEKKAQSHHTITLTIDSTKIVSQSILDYRIKTDHPSQQELVVSVKVFNGDGG